MDKKIELNLEYSPTFIASDMNIEAFESDMRELFRKDTLLSSSVQVKDCYLNFDITDKITIKNPFHQSTLLKNSRRIKCDLLHVIIYSPVKLLSFDEFNSVYKVMSKYLFLTRRTDSVIYSIFDSLTPSVSLVQLDSQETNNIEQRTPSNYINKLELIREKIDLTKDNDSIRQLMNAFSIRPRERYNLSWVQKKLGWGYNRSLNVVRQSAERKLLIVSDIKDPNPVILLNGN